MAEISEQDAAKLVSMIYRPDLSDEINMVGGNTEKEFVTMPCSVAQLVNAIETNIKDQRENTEFGGEMSKSEYQEVLNQIKGSDTLMSMQVVGFTNKEQTGFRAMTLVDPKNEVRPVVVFRGTASDWQWDDNLAGAISSSTPSHQEAQRYIIRTGYDHLTLAGHSKGGNMAASMAYLLPEGMVDKVYSFDGQGASDLFLARIPKERREYAKSIVHNINEYRDVVSQLLHKMGADKNTVYFDSGVNARDAGYTPLSELYYFHPHKPNYFLLGGCLETGRSFAPARAVHSLSGLSPLLRAIPCKGGMEIVKFLAGIMHNGRGEAWSDEYWNEVYDAEEMYTRVNCQRQESILNKLSELYGCDFSKYRLVQEKSSEVVEGAVLGCPYCSDIITLKNIKNHGKILQNKPVAWKKDCAVGTQICVENAFCAVVMQQTTCEPMVCEDWLITDPDKKIGGVEVVLKKSALGCLKGAMIEVVHNGQINPGDMEKRSLWKEWKDAVVDIAQKSLEVGKSMGILQNPVEGLKDVIDWKMGLQGWMADAVIMGCDSAADGVTQTWDEVQRQVNDAVEGYMEHWMEDQKQKISGH